MLVRSQGHPRRQPVLRRRQRAMRISLHAPAARPRLQSRRTAGPRRRV